MNPINLQNQMNELVRDACTIGYYGPKSQYRARLKQLIQDVCLEACGEDEELRDKSDMLEPTYHRVKGRNQLRSEIRQNIKRLVGEQT